MSDEYIKKEDAIKSIIRNDHTDVSKAFKRMYAEEMLSYVKGKDVVSIVRCHECKHWMKMDGKCFPNADYNDFCSNGERKDND